MHSRVALVLATVMFVGASVALAGFAGTDLFIPMAGRGVGAYPSNWFTTVYLYNPHPTAVAVDLTFLERNKDNVAAAPPRVTETLAPGETRIYENIVETTFGTSAYGAVRIQSNEKVVATARVFSKESADAPLTRSFGQDFAATPGSFAIGIGESTDILGGYTTQPYQDSMARFNIGCVETTGAGSATVRWTARDGGGVERARYDRTVPRLSQTQGLFHDYFKDLELTNARISASVISGAGRVICYGSLVTNDKEFPKPVQDPTTFEMTYKDSLLGASDVQHDATLVGDGTGGAPLGLADGAVTPAKISGAGANHGQVLKYGSGVAWTDDGVTLPYQGTVADPFAAFVVDNADDTVDNSSGILGRGHLGVSGTGRLAGVLGATAENPQSGFLPAGVSGVAGANIGVNGNSLSGDGVLGRSMSGAGVRGVSGTGYAGFFAGRVGIDGALECTGCVVGAGLANGAVTKGKLAALGGTSGQVLTTVGSDLVWRTPAAGIGGSGAGGQVGFWTGSSTLGADPAFTWDTVNHRLGIGTGTPGQQLELTGNLALPASTSAAAGVIQKGEVRFLHDYGTDNTFLGENAGNFTMTGSGQNTAVGANALPSNTTGYNNTALGYRTLWSNAGGSFNTAIGLESLFTNTVGYFNTATGHQSLYNNTEGQYNTATGESSLRSNTTGSHNTATGATSLWANTEGMENTAIGDASLFFNSTGSFSTAVGGGSLLGIAQGSRNTAIGQLAGFENSTGDGNVFLGFHAGFHEVGSNRLYIANSEVGDPLIYGQFDTGRVGLGTIAPTVRLDVNGQIRSRSWTGSGTTPVCRDLDGALVPCSSDARLKRNVASLAGERDVLALLGALRAVTFEWDSQGVRGGGRGTRDIGFIAQEVERVLPEAVHVEADGYRSMDYAKLTAVLVEAIKAQQQEIDELKAAMAAMRK